MIQNLATVISNRESMPGVYLMWLQSQEIAAKAKPGQFLMVKCGVDSVLRRPLSVHRVNGDKGVFALLFAKIGKGTDWLSIRQKGDTVDLLGPVGNGFSSEPQAERKLMIAGGIGIAPLCYLAETFVATGNKVSIMLGAATAEKLYPATLLPPEIELITATENGSHGHKGLITDLIPAYIDSSDEVFICGPMTMLHYLAEHRDGLGLAGKPVHVSLEMRMACGLGVCYGCTIRTKDGPKLVCKDGPIFRLDEIIWDEFAKC